MNEQASALNPGLFKLHNLFFLAIAVFAFLMAIIGIGSLVRGQEGAGIGLVGIGLLPLAAAHWFAAKGARIGASYGRTITRIIGFFWLFGIPVGTALGIYAWSKANDDNWVDGPGD